MKKNAESSANRVLLVVGDPVSRSFIQRTLESVLLQVETATRFEAAAEKIRAGSWALLILDPGLPKVDALDLLRDLEATAPDLLRKTILIVEPRGPLAETVAAFPLCHTIDRPVMRKQLIEAVSNCLRQQQEPK